MGFIKENYRSQVGKARFLELRFFNLEGRQLYLRLIVFSFILEDVKENIEV